MFKKIYHESIFMKVFQYNAFITSNKIYTHFYCYKHCELLKYSWRAKYQTSVFSYL